VEKLRTAERGLVGFDVEAGGRAFAYWHAFARDRITELITTRRGCRGDDPA